MTADTRMQTPFTWPPDDFQGLQDVVSLHAPDTYYDSNYRHLERAYLPALFAWLDEKARGRVLEIGPGWGTTMAWLSANGWTDITVMDIMPKGHWITQDLLDLCGAEYVQANICEGALSGKWDLIICTQVIGHLKHQPLEALGHVREMMAGEFIASAVDHQCCPDMASAYGLDWRAVPCWGAPRASDMVVTVYTAATFEELLVAAFGNARVWHPPGPLIFGEAHVHLGEDAG